MAVRIQLRRDTAANWSANNPLLYPGEIGIETDTLKFKIGPSSATAWNSIASYANVTPNGLSNNLNDYILAADLGQPQGPAELNIDGNLLIPYDSIIFEGQVNNAYETTLQVTEPTADRTITLPNVTGTVVTTGDTGSVTNTMLAGSIANNKLANSSVTINGYEIALGASASYGTDNINEGTTNKYFTDERAQDAVAQALANGSHTNITVSYDDANNAISLTGAQTYNNEMAQDAVAQALANGTHTNITVSYDDNANSISLTGAQTYSDENARDAVASLITGSSHTGISVAYTDDGSNAGTLAFTNTDKGSSQNIFKNIVVGATTVVADGNDDTLTFVGSNGVGALANATNDVIEFYNTGVTSLTGTSNEVEVNTSTGAVTVGLPDNVTIAGYLTLTNPPTSSNHAATKAYVDNITAGLNFHAAVHAATTTNLSATYDNTAKTLSASGTFPQIDGETILETERVLVKSQTDAKENGIYVLTDDGDPSGTWVLTRSSDADNSPAGEIAYGDFVFVQTGSLNGGYGYIMTTTGTITLGSSNINWTQFNTGQTVIAGNGLTETTPGTLAINTSVTVDLNTAQSLTNKTISGTFTGNITGNVTGNVTGDVSGNAGTVTNGVYTTGSYSNPSWITSLGWSKISSTPTTISGYGITDGVSTSGSYSDPTWLTISKSKVGLGNVENTALSTWAGSTNLTTLGTISTGTWSGTAIAVAKGGTGATDASTARTNLGLAIGTNVQAYDSTLAAVAAGTYTGSTSITTLGTIGTGTWSGTTIATTKGGTGLTSYTTGDILYASASNTLSKLGAGTDGYLLTMSSGIPVWAAAPISLPSQSGNTGKYLTTDGSTASWAALPISLPSTTTLSANTATTVDSTALSSFTSLEYLVSLKQGSKVRTSKVVVQTDGTSVDMTEFAITETGGTMSGVVVSATTSSSNAVLQVTVTDASSSNVTVKLAKISL